MQEVKRRMSEETNPVSGQPGLDFDRLLEQYQVPVLRVCYLYLCDRSQAEDAVQETFLRVYRGLHTFRGGCNEKTWIMKIAMRVCYDINHSAWYRFINRRVTPEMLPEAAAPFEEKDDTLTRAVIRLPIRLRRCWRKEPPFPSTASAPTCRPAKRKKAPSRWTCRGMYSRKQPAASSTRSKASTACFTTAQGNRRPR